MQKEKNVANRKVILNSIQSLSHLPLINHKRERCQIKFAMTPLFHNKAFTLVELLIVVLIIGILVAISSSTYVRAQYKSRTMEALAVLHAIAQAQEVYWMIHGEYTNDIKQLDVQIPAEFVQSKWNVGKFKNRYSYMCTAKRTCGAAVDNPSMPFLESVLQHDSSNPIFRGHKLCHLYENSKNAMARSICQSLGKLDTQNKASWAAGKYYILD